MSDDDKPLWQGIIETQSRLLTLQNTAVKAQKKRIAELEAVIAEFIYVESKGGGDVDN